MTKKLTRSTDEKWIGGVCGGISAYTGVDVNLVRLAVAVATVLGAGSLILAYIAAWIIMPPQPYGPPDVWPQATDSPATPTEPAPRSE